MDIAMHKKWLRINESKTKILGQIEEEQAVTKKPLNTGCPQSAETISINDFAANC